VISDREFITGSVVVVLPDEIDVVNAGSLGELLDATIVPGVTVVVADLMATNFGFTTATRWDPGTATTVRLRLSQKMSMPNRDPAAAA
jgi:hypothetical protein